LKPIEVELRRIENVIQEVVHDMEYLKIREQTMRNTNESTNERVKYFAMLSSMFVLRLC
jgi:p24 family protein delta-1